MLNNVICATTIASVSTCGVRAVDTTLTKELKTIHDDVPFVGMLEVVEGCYFGYFGSEVERSDRRLEFMVANSINGSPEQRLRDIRWEYVVLTLD